MCSLRRLVWMKIGFLFNIRQRSALGSRSSEWAQPSPRVFAIYTNNSFPKKGTVSSIILNWFSFAASDSEQTTPRCKVCLKCVASNGSSTTNLLQHLKQRHAAEWERWTRPRQHKHTRQKTSAVSQTFTNCTRYDKNGVRWKAITDAVAMYIAKDMVPIYAVEKPGFIHMLKVLGCRYVLPSRQYFSEVALPPLYYSTRQRIVRELEGLLFYSKRVSSFYVLCYVKSYVTLHYVVTLCYIFTV